jgi:hypothetical protein
MNNGILLLVPKMTEMDALAEARERWGEHAQILRRSENCVCVSGGNSPKDYGEGENFEEAFIDAEQRALFRSSASSFKRRIVGDRAYLFVAGREVGTRIVYVRFLGSGYYPSCIDDRSMTKGGAATFVAALNRRLGIPADVVESMHSAALSNWLIPAAQRAVEFFADRKERKAVDSTALHHLDRSFRTAAI